MRFLKVIFAIFLLLSTLYVDARGIGGGGSRSSSSSSSSSRGGGLFGSGGARPSIAPPTIPAKPAAPPLTVPAPQRTGIGAAPPQQNTAPPSVTIPTAQRTGIGSTPPAPSPTKPITPPPPIDAKPIATPPQPIAVNGAGVSALGSQGGVAATTSAVGSGINGWHLMGAAALGMAAGYALSDNDTSVATPTYTAAPTYVSAPAAAQPTALPQTMVYTSAANGVLAPTPAPATVISAYQPIQPTQPRQEESTIMATLLTFILLAIVGVFAYIVKKHYDAWKKHNAGDFNKFYNSKIGSLFNPIYFSDSSGKVLTGAYNQTADEASKFIDIFIKIQKAYFNNESLNGLLTDSYREHIKRNYQQPTEPMPSYLDMGINCLICKTNNEVFVTYFYQEKASFVIEEFKFKVYGGKYLLDGVI